MSRRLTDEETAIVLSVDRKTINNTIIKQWIFDRPDRPAMFREDDVFKLPKDTLFNGMDCLTTVGIYIMNLTWVCLNNELGELFGYVNTPFNKKVVEGIIDDASMFVYKHKLSTDSYVNLLNAAQFRGGDEIALMLSPSMSKGLMQAPKEVVKEQEKLFKENKEALDSGDAVVATDIKNSIIDRTVDYLKNNDKMAMQSIASGGKIGVDDLAKMTMMAGPAQDTRTGEYKMVKSNLNKGISKRDYAKFTDSAVNGAYSRSTAVAVGGYLTKRSHQIMNTVSAAKPGTDCGTTEYLPMKLFKEFKAEYLFRYIKDGDKLVLLTDDNYDQYVGKIVQLRSPMFCHRYGKEGTYCSKCTGEQPYMVGITNYGLAMARMSNNLLQFQLKKFHVSSIQYTTAKPEDFFHWH